MRDPAERLRDILEAIAAIERHCDCDKQSFERDELLQTWFVRHLQILGEAARAIPEPIRALATDIPWREITGMRNVIVHGYFEIDTDLVWDTATRDVPAIKPAIELCSQKFWIPGAKATPQNPVSITTRPRTGCTAQPRVYPNLQPAAIHVRVLPSP